MNKYLLLLAGIALSEMNVAQVSVSVLGTVVTTNFTGYNGTGFAPAPAAGQLSSNDWSTEGMSDGPLNYGGTNTIGDYARGSTTGGVTTGGFYAYTYGGSNSALWIQPTSADFNPGNIAQRYINNTGSTINTLDISYKAFVLNDQARSSAFNFQYSADNISFTQVNSVSISSVEADEGSLYVLQKSVSLTGLSITAGAFFYIRWVSEDISGLGSRDEFGLDNIKVTASATTTCFAPAWITVGNITPTSAQLTWNPVGGAIKYKIQYRPSGSTTWLNKVSMNTTKTLTALTPQTSYQFHIRTICSGVNSPYSNIQDFMTLPLKLETMSPDLASLSVYPNPGSGRFTISLPGMEAEPFMIRIATIDGRIVFERNATGLSSTEVVDISAEPAGIYLLTVTIAGEVKMQKLVLQ